MVFASLSFLTVFLPGVFLGWLILPFTPARHLRREWLLLCSLLFYAYDGLSHLPLLLVSIAFNILVGSHLHPDKPHTRRWLAAGVAVNLLTLGYFKYTGFLLDNVHQAMGDIAYEPAAIALPLGISFFTFQHIAYLVDRAKGLAPAPSWRDYGLFITFFPQLIAGPIVHHREMMPQFGKAPRSDRIEELLMGLAILSFGLFKKTILADTFAPWADTVFHATIPLDTFTAWIGVLSYALQLYFDFSAYSDMAIGAGLLFGIRLPINFFSPYASASIAEFWRTWHITLGRWLREYVYIPLGGNQNGARKTIINLFITMLLAGLWHGAGWGFIVWGVLHGIAMGIHRLWTTMGMHMHRAAGRLLTLGFVILAWVPFRSPTLEQGITLWKSMIPRTMETVGQSILSPILLLWCLAALCICVYAPNTLTMLGYSPDRPLPPLHSRTMIAAACALFLGLMPLLLHKETPFIYFGF